jgi:hypothetical protein
LEHILATPHLIEKILVEVPLVPWLGASTLQLIRVVLPKLPTPLADGLVGHINAALEQELLHVAVASREARVQPDAVADDLAGKAVVLITRGVGRGSHV